MPRPPKSAAKNQDSTATIGFEANIRKEHDDTSCHVQHPDFCVGYAIKRDKAYG
jgi:hypothetical protein